MLREAGSPQEDRPARGTAQAALVRALLTPGTLEAVPAQGRLQVGPEPPSPVHLVDHLPTSQTSAGHCCGCQACDSLGALRPTSSDSQESWDAQVTQLSPQVLQDQGPAEQAGASEKEGGRKLRPRGRKGRDGSR